MTPTITELAKDVKELREGFVEHRVRLENGVRVFAKHDEAAAKQDVKIQCLEDTVAPKPTPIFKVVGIALTAFVLMSGGIWAVADKLAERPTAGQMERQLERVVERNQEELGHIRKDMAEQRSLIKDVKASQAELRVDMRQTTKTLQKLVQKPPTRRGR